MDRVCHGSWYYFAAVLALDVAVFRWANRVSDHLDESRMLVTEKVFGILFGRAGGSTHLGRAQ